MDILQQPGRHVLVQMLPVDKDVYHLGFLCRWVAAGGVRGVRATSSTVPWAIRTWCHPCR
jgi:hypothetical protein